MTNGRGCDPSRAPLPCRAFVARKAKQLASRPLRGPLLNPRKGEIGGVGLGVHPVAIGETRRDIDLPPLAGEMPGRAEGGVTERNL